MTISGKRPVSKPRTVRNLGFDSAANTKSRCPTRLTSTAGQRMTKGLLIGTSDMLIQVVFVRV